MTQKPKIQYVGQFYVHGSEAQVPAHPQRKKTKTQLPQSRVDRTAKIYIDPVAILSIGVAVLMLVVMVLGALQIRDDWAQYDRMHDRVSQLRQENALLHFRYRNTYHLDEVRTKAENMGLIPKDSVKTQTFRLTLPEPEAETTLWDDIVWFFDELLP